MDELDVKKVQAEAKRTADLANRLLKEGAAKATIEAAKAIHEYNNVVILCNQNEIILSASIQEYEIIEEEHERTMVEYKKRKHEFKEFPTSKQLKGLYKVAKKQLNQVDERLQAALQKVDGYKKEQVELKALKKQRDEIKTLLDNYRAKINDQESNLGDSVMALDLKKEMKFHLE